MPGDFTFIPKADLEAVMGPTRGDRPARVVNIPGGANLGAYILHYPPIKNTLPANSFYHSEITELYYVIRGEGTALLGGELEKPTWRPTNTTSFRQVSGPGVAGTLKGYTTQKWGPGDIIIVPAGIPHTIGFEVTVTNDILRVVIDPKRALNLVRSRSESLALAQAPEGPAPADAAPPKPGPANMPGTSTFIPKAAQDAKLKAIVDGAPQDQVVRMVDTPSGHLGAYVLHWEPRTPAPGAPANAFYHSEITEFYHVLRGSGTILLGGEIANATEGDPNGRAVKEVSGPTANGTMAGRYTTQKITAGDSFIVPAGVPHAMGYEVTAPLEILRVVIDPKKVLPVK
jgi:mannose-6-phosphate isomerase-like protein (cupin superfamily)